jgi:hypothetical protein
LVNAPQALVIGMTHHLEHQRIVDADETVNGIVDDLAFETHAGAKVSAL